MFEIFVTIIILILFVSIIVASYYIYTYYKQYTNEVNSKFKKLDSRVDGEQVTRKRNINNIVDQINVVNNDINKEVTNAKLSINQNAKNINAVSKGIDSVFSFTSNANNANSNLRLSDLPGSGVVNMNLLSHVSALGGLNIKDLYYTGVNDNKQFKISGKNNTDYVTIPDENGAINVKAAMAFNKGSIPGATISTVGTNRVYVKTKSFGIGEGDAPLNPHSTVPPNASMHIMAYTGDDKVPFKISLDNNDVFKIRKSGIILARGIYLTPDPKINVVNEYGTPRTTRIEVSNSGELIITPPYSPYEPNRKGNIYVNGNIKVSGTINSVGGNISQTSIDMREPISINENEGFTSSPIMMEDDKKRTATPVDYMNSRYLLPKPPACM